MVSPWLEGFPDITFLTILFLVFVLIVDGYFGKLSVNVIYILPIVLLLLSYLLYTISLVYSISPTYKYLKAALFAINMLAFIYPLISRRVSRRNLIYISITFIFIIDIVFILVYPMVKTGIIALNEMEYLVYRGMYLTASLVAGLGILLLFFQDTIKNRLPFFFIFIITILIAGARGTVFSLGLVFIILLITNANNIVWRVKIKARVVYIVTLLLLISGAGLLYILSQPEIYDLVSKRLNRFDVFSESNTAQRTSLDDRFEHLKFVKDSFNSANYREIVFGYGIGSYSNLKDGEDRKDHPHNFIIEAFFETGILGFLILVLFIAITFYLIIRINKKFWLIALYVFINALKSSSIVEIRILFAIFAICLLTETLKLSYRRIKLREA